MKKIAYLLLLALFVSCSSKKVDDLSEANSVSIPFKLGKIKFDDKRSNVVAPEINLSLMPSEENKQEIEPILEDEFQLELESIIQRAFRGSTITYDVVVVIKKANKYMSKTWKESQEKSDVELVIELTNDSDNSSFYQAKSNFSYNYDAPNVTDKHAQELYEKTFKNALYLGLKKIQDEIRK